MGRFSMSRAALAGLFVFLAYGRVTLLQGAAQNSSSALTGQVTSVQEGPMEGVLVSARRDGSTITVSVVSDAQGRYTFPQERLAPGRYSLQIRAVGYDIDDPGPVQITPHRKATGHLKLHRTSDIS